MSADPKAFCARCYCEISFECSDPNDWHCGACGRFILDEDDWIYQEKRDEIVAQADRDETEWYRLNTPAAKDGSNVSP